MGTAHIEIEDLPVVSAEIDFTATYEREDRSTGSAAGWLIENLTLVNWNIGGLQLSREQLVQAVGEDEVQRLEEIAIDDAVDQAKAEAEAAALDYGDWLHDRRRDAMLDARFAAE